MTVVVKSLGFGTSWPEIESWVPNSLAVWLWQDGQLSESLFLHLYNEHNSLLIQVTQGSHEVIM